MLPDLLDQIPADEPVGIVTADGAYDTRACHAAIAARGAAAVAPPGKNGKPWKEHTAGARAATRRSASANASAGPSGDDGAAITDEAWLRPRCAVSSGCRRASWSCGRSEA